MRMIDRYLPTWDFSKKNSIALHVQSLPPISTVYDVDFSKSFIIKALFFLRGIPIKHLNLNCFMNIGFLLLAEDEQEIVIGLIGQPWRWSGGIEKVSPEDFISFNLPNYTKIVWNFTFETSKEEVTNISTETRIHCTSPHAKQKFRFYWGGISFFSGIIRNEMLRILRNELLEDYERKRGVN